MVTESLAQLGLPDSFDITVTQDDVTHHEPDPAPYLLALDRLKLNATDALVFEDSEAGLKAALAAGCSCVAIRHAFNARHDFSRAARIISDFDELKGISAAQIC
jgi:beta-phosphoglucomutase-like phosphatase (HAD superfamily)